MNSGVLFCIALWWSILPSKTYGLFFVINKFDAIRLITLDVNQISSQEVWLSSLKGNIFILKCRKNRYIHMYLFFLKVCIQYDIMYLRFNIQNIAFKNQSISLHFWNPIGDILCLWIDIFMFSRRSLHL